jgi:5-methyltetrahydrofolate--homocysteine methyltransferase
MILIYDIKYVGKHGCLNLGIGDRFKDFDKQLKNNSDILNLTQPEIVTEVHKAYLDAGADIIETNTFNG